LRNHVVPVKEKELVFGLMVLLIVSRSGDDATCNMP